jgi:HYR domain
MINNNPSSLFALPAILLLLLLLLSFSSSPSVIMAQPQTGGATTTIPSPSPLTPSPPLTPEEQEEQNRLQNVIAATNQNLDEAEKQVGGVVYTPRWSNPVWVEPGALSILIAYCLPGEFAESGQEILGGFELEVLESYEIALPQNFTAWMMVIGNEDRQDRLPAAVGVICASDLNQADTRILSPEEQQQINNVVQQFITTQVTNIEQVINIINNVTVNATEPVTPPTNDTGGIPENATAEADRTPPVFTYIEDYSWTTSDPEGMLVAHSVIVEDNVDGHARIDNYPGNLNVLVQDNVGGPITISCNPPSGSIFPVGVTTVQCTATDASGNTAQGSFTFTVELVPPPTLTVPQNIVVEASSTLPGLPAPSSANVKYSVTAQDYRGGTATLEEDGSTITQDNVPGVISISCDPPSGSEFPVGVTTVQCTATDDGGNTGTASFTVRVNRPPVESPFLAQEQPPPPPPAAAPLEGGEEAPVQEEEQPPAEDEEAPPAEDEGAASPPANDEGGG